MGQNVTCSSLKNKCNFTGSEQNREGGLVFLFFFLFSGNWQFGFWKWQDKLHAECCWMSELNTWAGTKWLIHFQKSHLNISVPLYPCLWISNIKLANLLPGLIRLVFLPRFHIVEYSLHLNVEWFDLNTRILPFLLYSKQQQNPTDKQKTTPIWKVAMLLSFFLLGSAA